MLRRLIAFFCVLLLSLSVVSPAHADGRRHQPRPVVFVHGFSGSAGQFETQARRLTSNGYPDDFIEAHEYDSTFGTTTVAEVFASLDDRIARLLDRTGADKIDLLAHSLGTGLMQSYLRSSPARAANVAHYVNLDGATADSLPGGVPTLAVWGEGPTEREVTGAENVYFSGQAHTQVVTSPETFAQFFEFFNERKPRTTRIVPQRHIALSGRAVLFPSNEGAAGARLEIYRVNPLTGARLTQRPLASYTLPEDGAWGPFKGRGDAHYEFAVVWDESSVHHLYSQPFRRSNGLVRLLTSRPGEGLSGLVETGDRHAALTISRQKEWWGDQGREGDALYINGRQVLNEANAPRTKRAIGIFAFDAGRDRVTDLSAPLPAFFATPFITGMDVFMPTGRFPVSIVAKPRGGHG
ncbi:alpha/beta hydrolase, partial [Actinomadura sp. GC306]|uniref:alpha/beta fold hydrolase n=1 Tax=Actinomadura sp. GC306 TaxID=2530367 RepID=UPI00104FDDB0